jgi:hypothetical protein
VRWVQHCHSSKAAVHPEAACIIAYWHRQANIQQSTTSTPSISRTGYTLLVQPHHLLPGSANAGTPAALHAAAKGALLLLLLLHVREHLQNDTSQQPAASTIIKHELPQI